MAKIRYIFIKEKMMKEIFIFNGFCKFLFGNDYDVGLDFYKINSIKMPMNIFKSANSGNSQAAHNLAIMYHNGDGVKKIQQENQSNGLQIASDAKNPLCNDTTW